MLTLTPELDLVTTKLEAWAVVGWTECPSKEN